MLISLFSFPLVIFPNYSFFINEIGELEFAKTYPTTV